MPQPTKAELQSKFDALQQDYKTKLDDIFDRLYKRLDDIESVAPQAPTTPVEPAVAAAASTPPQSPEMPKATTPEAPAASTQAPPVSAAPVARSQGKPPRWRDTWTYQGLKGLASRVWRGTNPEDAAWKHANENEGLLPHLTLHEYLDLREATNDFVDYYFVIEEAMQPEVSKEFSIAKIEITKLVLDFLKQAHDLGIKAGDLAAVTRHMFPPKQQFLFDKTPDKEVVPTDKDQVPADKEVVPTDKEVVPTDKDQEPEPVISPEAWLSGKSKPKNEKKKVELPVIENPDQKQGEIMGDMMDTLRREDLEPFKPWTWFSWAKKPSGIYKKFPNAQEALLKQWQDQAGNKFTDEAEGLTNLFLALGKGWFGNIDYTNNKIVTTTISKLIGKEVKGRPWTDFVGHFKNDETSAEIYLSDKGVGKPSRAFSANTPESPPLESALTNSSIEDYQDEDGSYSD